jgi:hypothetical protein
MRSGLPSIVGLIYRVIGLIVASGHTYFAHLNAVMPIFSAILAVVLWPLILVGVNLHLHSGDAASLKGRTSKCPA